MRDRTISRVVPIAAAIAGVTIAAFTLGRAVAHPPNETLTSLQRGPLWTELIEPGIGPGHTIAQGHMGRGWMRGDRWGYGPQHGRMYDLNTVETVRGRIVNTESFTPAAGMSPGMQISVDTGTETLPIHLGPHWFVDSQNLNLVSGDEIEITGSRVDFAGRPTIVASEVQRGDTAIALRDTDGVPVWSHWRQEDGRWGPGACCR